MGDSSEYIERSGQPKLTTTSDLIYDINIYIYVQSLASSGEGDLGQAVGCPGKKWYFSWLAAHVTTKTLYV